MKYTLSSPCDQCPFLARMAHGFSIERLEQFARGEFHCHKTGEFTEPNIDGGSEARPLPESLHCAGALIYLERQGRSHQMMRIAERLGLYDRSKLNMDAPVREVPA